jgi:hypothetical protein
MLFCSLSFKIHRIERSSKKKNIFYLNFTLKSSTVILTVLGFESKLLTDLQLKPFNIISLKQRDFESKLLTELKLKPFNVISLGQRDFGLNY